MNTFVNHVSKNHQKLLTFVFKILRFAEYRQLTKSCWDKNIMKQKTLHGIRYVNKKIIKKKMTQSCEQDLLLLVTNYHKKRQITLKKLHSLANSMKQDMLNLINDIIRTYLIVRIWRIQVF